MPKLSKTRIINLNYNDGKRTIYNEIFDYGDGKNTLFSMDNGIGKTVLIQFFLQPFVRNKRELQGRKFEDYFSNTPTYIMHEVLLENGEKLLAGMLIKKESSEDEKNSLRILAFLNKYSKPNDFDIINVPFVENKKILSFSECEDKIKKYKSGKLNFDYYNFNDSSKKSKYFADLKSYRIDYKEWEDIIRNINNDESGLSNLYDKHKNDEALIRNVIIPLIESKINGEKNVTESIRNNLSKYIESYKQSKESIYEVELFKAFQGDMGTVTQLLKEGIVKDNAREALYKRLAGIAILCEEELIKKSTEKLRHEELVEELNNELTRVAYEEHSLKYYNYLAQEEKKAGKLLELKNDRDNKNLDKQALVKEKYLQECAEIYEDILADQSSLAEIRERIANYEREDSEVAQNIRNYKFTLKKLYLEELKELRQKAENLQDKQGKQQFALKENEQQLNANSLQQKQNITAAEACKNRIRNFVRVEGDYKKRYTNFKAVRNVLLDEYDEQELESYRLYIADSINSNLSFQENLQKETTDLINAKETIRQKLKNINSDLNQSNLELEKKKNNLNHFNNETAKISQILTVKNLPLDPASQRDKLSELIKSENAKLQQTLVNEQDKLREIEDTIHRYETGLIQIPKEVLQSFESKGIQFEYCLNWLQSYRGSKEEKENLIKNNPFFPYGILLSTKDINVLKNESIDVYTSIPIPIINRSDLTKGLAVDKTNDVLTIQNQEFLLSFNCLLIDEEERAELIKGLILKIDRLKTEISNIQNSLDRNKGYEKTLADYPYRGDEDGILRSDINKLEQHIDKLEELSEQYNDQLQDNENRREAINKELHKLEVEHIGLAEQREKFNEFILEHQEFKQNNKELDSLQRLMKELEDAEKRFKEDNSKIRGFLRKLDRESDRNQESIEICAAKLELYKTVDTGTFIEEAKENIEARLQACEKELDGNIRRDKDEEKRLSENLRKHHNKLNRIAKEGSISNEYLAVSFSSYRLEELKNNIDTLEEELKALTSQIHNVDKEASIFSTKRQRELEDIIKLGFNNPISKGDIKNPDFQRRRNRINEDLKQNEEIIQGYSHEIERLKLLRPRLESFKSYNTTTSEMDFNFNNLSAALDVIDKDFKTYEAIKNEIFKMEREISDGIRQIHEKYRDLNKFLKDRLNSYLCKERKIANHSDIESLLEVIDRKIRTLELELKSIKMEEEVVINEILRYTNHVLQELKTIDKKSNIKHLGKTQKLLEINIPEEKDEESLKEYIKEKAQYYAYYEGDYSSQLDSDIQSAELLSKLMGNINRIRVDIKKIEKTGLVRKSWREALSQNSGGEKFVSMFILLSSLMSYMRKRETDIDNKEEKKILIMDNPFAKTNAEHLLEPMFQIAEKYNIQLLCFSGIGGSAVYNRFSKIYVAKVIQDRFRNKENVSFKAGNEETLELSDFTITREQVSMF